MAEILLMQIDIIVMCPVFFLATTPKYQLSDVATVDQATEALEEKLAHECVRFVLDWHIMIMGSYLPLGYCLIHVIPLVSVIIQMFSRKFGNV